MTIVILRHGIRLQFMLLCGTIEISKIHASVLKSRWIGLGRIRSGRVMVSRRIFGRTGQRIFTERVRTGPF
jgi:hypothetical protein